MTEPRVLEEIAIDIKSAQNELLSFWLSRSRAGRNSHISHCYDQLAKIQQRVMALTMQEELR